MKVDIFMPYYIADYERDTADLSFEEHGFYIAILRSLWSNRGTLLFDEIRLSRMLRTDISTFQRLWLTTGKFFTLCEDGSFYQKRGLQELHKALKLRERAAEGGRRSAVTRFQKTGSAQPPRSEKSGNYKNSPPNPLPNQTPKQPSKQTPKQTPNTSPSHSDPDPDQNTGVARDPSGSATGATTGASLAEAMGGWWDEARRTEFGGAIFGFRMGMKSETIRNAAETIALNPTMVEFVERSMRKFWAAIKRGEHHEAEKISKSPPFAFSCWLTTFVTDVEEFTGQSASPAKVTTGRRGSAEELTDKHRAMAIDGNSWADRKSGE